MYDDEIDAWMTDHADEIIEFAADLVRIPTENQPPWGHELAGQQWLAERMRAQGAQVDLFTPDDVPELRDHPAYSAEINGSPRSYRDRPNVVGVFPGTGGGRSLLLSTHVDTVAAQSDAWSGPGPFSGAVDDGRLYGRGSYDTKACLASHLFAIRCLTELGVPRLGDVIVESVVDEEFGGSNGVLAARLRGYNADIGINSEPTHLDVCPAHRGGREAYLHLRGGTGMAFHGENPPDAIRGLGRVICALAEFNDARNTDAVGPELFRETGPLPLYLNQVGGGGTTYEEAIATPESTYLHLWAETLPGVTAEEFDAALLSHVRAALDADPATRGVELTLTPTTRFLPGSNMPLDHPALAVLEAAYETVAGRAFRLRGAPFACDAYMFNLHSPTPAIVLGPGGGGAHAPDEYVDTADVIDLGRILARFISRWCNEPPGDAPGNG